MTKFFSHYTLVLIPTSHTFGINSDNINKKGFTLVELLIVISIIAILSVIGMVIYSSVQKNARDARRKADIDSMAQSAEIHYNTTANQNCTNPAVSYCPLQGSWFSSGVIPSDPTPGNLYCGWQTGVGVISPISDNPSSSNGAAGPWTTKLSWNDSTWF